MDPHAAPDKDPQLELWQKLVSIATWYLEFSAGVIEIGKKLVIWAVFFTLLWLGRDFFGLIFVTFILAFMANSLVVKIERRYPGRHRLIVSSVYAAFLLVLSGLLSYTVPRIYKEGESFVQRLGPLKDQTTKRFKDYMEENQDAKAAFRDLQVEDKLKNVGQEALDWVKPFLETAVASVLQTVSYFLLSILFSFLIVFDLPNLKRGVARLKDTKLASFYAETGESVVMFGSVVGRIFQAQAVIAALNTCLTLAGLFVLGIPSKGVLCIIVFFCSFIPVIGVFISSAPIVLLAVNQGGLSLALEGVALITIVHMVEAYILNPRIYASHMHMNPVLTLMVLFVAHHGFGLWGVLLGVPVCYYVFKYAISLEPLSQVDKPVPGPGAATAARQPGLAAGPPT